MCKVLKKNNGIKLYEELQSQGTPMSIHLRSENDKVHKVGKSDKKLMGYQNYIHIFRLWRKHVQSFKKIGIKLYEELHS